MVKNTLQNAYDMISISCYASKVVSAVNSITGNLIESSHDYSVFELGELNIDTEEKQNERYF